MVKWLSKLLAKRNGTRSSVGDGAGQQDGQPGDPVSERDFAIAVSPSDVESKQAGNIQTPEASIPSEKNAKSESEALIKAEKKQLEQAPARTILEELLLQRPGERNARPSTLEPQIQPLDTSTVFNGEVELAIAAPMEPEALSKLFTYLQSTPDLKVLYTRGSWERGAVITVVLDKPMPLLSMISNIQGLQIAPGAQNKDMLIKGSSSSLFAAKKGEARRLNIMLKMV